MSRVDDIRHYPADQRHLANEDASATFNSI
jgi:hypothetical protein